MPKVRVTESIDRPVDEVWAYVSDLSSMTEWMASVNEVEPGDDGGYRRGSRFRETDRFLGRSLEFVQELTEYEPPSRVSFESVSGPFNARVSIGLEPKDGTTVVTMAAEAEGGLGGIFGKLVDPIVTAAFERESRGDLTRLKDILESHPSEVN